MNHKPKHIRTIMKSKTLFFTITAILVAGAGVLAFENYYPGKLSIVKKQLSNPDAPLKKTALTPKEKFKPLQAKVPEIKEEIKRLDFYGGYCFMINMAIDMGKERFFVYDLKKDSVIAAALVTHGQGSGNSSKVEFSNKPNSYCTSLGNYKIGAAYFGKFGLAYKLYGLNSTNSNAYGRAVVLHAHSCVPDTEVYPLNICESLGCPTVSPAFLQRLKKYIERADKPVMLSIYNEPK